MKQQQQEQVTIFFNYRTLHHPTTLTKYNGNYGT